MRPLVYLAGSISGLSYDSSTDWRVKVRQALLPDIECLSPMRDTEHLVDEKEIGFGYTDHPLRTDAAIFARDMLDIRRSSLVLVNFLDAPAVSRGTLIELGVIHERGIPCILVMEPSGNIHDYPFVREIADVRVSSLPEAVDAVRSFLVPG